MRGSSVQVEWHDDEAALKAAYLREQDGRIKPRLQGLWLIRSGLQVKEAAALVGVNQRTAKQWVAWYRQGGLDLVRSRRRGGKGQTSRLTREQHAVLLKQARSAGFGSVKEAAAWVKAKWGVAYTESGMGGVLARLALRKKVPRPQNAQASQAVQAGWKRGD